MNRYVKQNFIKEATVLDRIRSTETRNSTMLHRLIQLQHICIMCVDVDIKGFFDNVNHSKLIQSDVGIWEYEIKS